MPAGIQPPIVVQYNASSVPVLQLSLTSYNLNEQQLYDYGIYRLRQQLVVATLGRSSVTLAGMFTTAQCQNPLSVGASGS